ncbi:protein STPG4-like isoform X2 [Lineus longissimus]|uniref:protein STPG4-like isoform X2 n=1 Tax=Lineus longissimus TaxID=88925 RepID=UPI002B4D1D41
MSALRGWEFGDRFPKGWEFIRTPDLHLNNQILRPNSRKNEGGRQGLKEGYEEPVSNREDWWRSTIKETPVPGAYELDDFLKEKEKAKITYNFKNEGRKRDPTPHGKGSTLLPGAYAHRDFIHELDKKRVTYNFKSTSRTSQDFLNKGIKDKDVNVSPDRYPMEKYLSCTVEKQPSKHFFFRSQSQRFPPAFYKPREGPPPGAYGTMTASSPMISSSFKSKTPRFSSAHTKVPGPGSYEKTYQSPMPGTIAKMGRQHGLFFACAFH